MATASGPLSGDYFESCSCDSLCPCFPSNLAAPPTKGDCHFAMVFHDERATAEQRQAISTIASGQASGPMAPLGAMISTFLGTVVKTIHYQIHALQRSVTIPGTLDQAVDEVSSATRPGEPLFIDTALHPANTRLALGRATQSHLHVFGLDWDETSGHHNGHFAPFHWRS
jgi:hypothetical protein